jgi:hypothetical protein
MLLIEIILYAGLFALTWSLIASLLMFTFERAHLLEFAREWIVAKLMGVPLPELQKHLGYHITFVNMEEMQDYYRNAWEHIAMESKWARLFTCQICFTVNLGLWLALFIGFQIYGSFDILAASMLIKMPLAGFAEMIGNIGLFAVFVTAFNFWFSQKV